VRWDRFGVVAPNPIIPPIIGQLHCQDSKPNGSSPNPLTSESERQDMSQVGYSNEVTLERIRKGKAKTHGFHHLRAGRSLVNSSYTLVLQESK
jgi:hypothetical protein